MRTYYRRTLRWCIRCIRANWRWAVHGPLSLLPGEELVFIYVFWSRSSWTCFSYWIDKSPAPEPSLALSDLILRQSLFKLPRMVLNSLQCPRNLEFQEGGITGWWQEWSLFTVTNFYGRVTSFIGIFTRGPLYFVLFHTPNPECPALLWPFLVLFTCIPSPVPSHFLPSNKVALKSTFLQSPWFHFPLRFCWISELHFLFAFFVLDSQWQPRLFFKSLCSQGWPWVLWSSRIEARTTMPCLYRARAQTWGFCLLGLHSNPVPHFLPPLICWWTKLVVFPGYCE